MSKFRVLLVYPNLQMVNLLPSNVSILSACLRNADIDVKLFDTTFYRTAEKSVDDVRVEHMQLRPFDLKKKESFTKRQMFLKILGGLLMNISQI